MLHLSADNMNIDDETVVTIGNFDGFHIGHKRLCQRAIDEALNKGIKSLLLTFNPHPVKVLKGIDVKLLFTDSEKRDLARDMGFDIFLEYPFTPDFAQTSGEDFIKSVLYDKLNCKVLVVGEGFGLGKGKSFGSIKIDRFSSSLGIEVITLPLLSSKGEKVSSTLIRELISKGDMGRACYYLGKDYFVDGVVEHGRKVGHKLGFPTMNVFLPKEKLAPKKGVYITQTVLNTGEEYPSITNLGNNVTFGYYSTRLETYAFGLNRDVYGEKIRIRFKKFLRGETKFDSPEALSEQLNRDLEAMKIYYNL
ncbi:MAG: bifunctional riboflavin kinase/FAD synthetase [Clostridiales bacterium]|jgi:riboflavin kinase/FMN adenylyltransferase|nr:bifunctional riboflavin kinase/FAD synthetase [Clostridiales bacterium]